MVVEQYGPQENLGGVLDSAPPRVGKMSHLTITAGAAARVPDEETASVPATFTEDVYSRGFRLHRFLSHMYVLENRCYRYSHYRNRQCRFR